MQSYIKEIIYDMQTCLDVIPTEILRGRKGLVIIPLSCMSWKLHTLKKISSEKELSLYGFPCEFYKTV